MNWNPRPSAWKEMQIRQERAKAFRAKEEDQRTNLSSLLSTASSDKIAGAAELAARAAVVRISEQAVAKVKDNARVKEEQAVRDVIWRNKI